jgi:hypothetical protein
MKMPLSQIVPRLEKLLLMLSSERDGEVINAARAISRTLQAIGADWHDLAAGLLAPSARTRAKKPPRETSEDKADVSWRTMLAFCVDCEERLRGREQEFITSLLHWRGQPTEKQLDWLTAIYERLSA